MEDFIFPASKIVVQNRKNGAETPLDPVVPICTQPLTINAAFELLVAMCVNCVANLRMVADMLTDMYYSGEFTANAAFELLVCFKAILTWWHQLVTWIPFAEEHHFFLFFVLFCFVFAAGR